MMAATTMIRVDHDIVEYLANKAEPFESRNAVLRRLFGLPPTKSSTAAKKADNKSKRKNDIARNIS